AASRRVVRPGPRQGGGARHRDDALRALGAVLGRSRHTRHVQRGCFVGGPDTAPHTPQRSSRPGEAGALLVPTPARPAAPAVGSPARHRPLERAGGGGRTLARGARGGARPPAAGALRRSEEHTSELQSRSDLVCRLLLEKKNKYTSQEEF